MADKRIIAVFGSNGAQGGGQVPAVTQESFSAFDGLNTIARRNAAVSNERLSVVG